MGRPFFSIVIPVYNRAASIKKVIDSCIDQSYSDFEVIIVDDGSRDDLKNVVNKIDDRRIRYIYQKNSGGAAARNKGIIESKGRFVAFLDSDDQFVKDKLLKVFKSIEELPPQNLVVFSSIFVDRGVGKYWIKPPRAIFTNERVSDYVMADRGFLQTSTLVIEAELAKKTLFQVGLPFGQDTDFAVRLEKNHAIFQMLEEPLVIWSDTAADDRVSNGKDYEPILAWLDSLKEFISPKAYFTYKGFHIARLARKRSIWLAYKLFFEAFFSGNISLKVAIISFLQITLSREQYRKLADQLVKIKGQKSAVTEKRK